MILTFVRDCCAKLVYWEWRNNLNKKAVVFNPDHRLDLLCQWCPGWVFIFTVFSCWAGCPRATWASVAHLPPGTGSALPPWLRPIQPLPAVCSLCKHKCCALEPRWSWRTCHWIRAAPSEWSKLLFRYNPVNQDSFYFLWGFFSVKVWPSTLKRRVSATNDLTIIVFFVCFSERECGFILWNDKFLIHVDCELHS